jgi:ABC-type Na+ transport system ATPase subunit NatA
LIKSYIILNIIFSIRIYFNQGESVLIKPTSGEMEETQEVCDRLIGITTGCEVCIDGQQREHMHDGGTQNDL